MNETFYRDAIRQLNQDIYESEQKEAALAMDLAAVQGRLSDMRNAAVSLGRLLGEVTGQPAAQENTDSPQKTVRHADVAEHVLRELGVPRRVPELGVRMAQTGHPLPTDPRSRDSAVQSAMRRRPEIFVNLGRGFWALKEWKNNPADRRSDLNFPEDRD